MSIEQRVYEVLINLLGNAVKFTEKGFVALKVNVLHQNKKEMIVQFIVEDTGTGISAEKYNFIFEQFSRTTSSYQGNHTGIGLGLRVVKQLINEMEDAEIEVESEQNKGSKFICTIAFAIPICARLEQKDGRESVVKPV